MNWLKLANIGNSKIVKSMLIWMLITPILAKALSSVNSVTLPFFQTDQNLTLSLPFSWQVFFFCALAFTIANIIFTYKCPSIISKYNNFADFKTKEDSRYLLINYLHEHTSEQMVYDNFLEIGGIVSKYTPDHSIAKEWTRDDASDINWRKGIDSLKHIDVVNMPDIFSALRILLAKQNPMWRIVSTGFYGLGFIGVLVVIVQNASFVYEQLNF